MSVKNNVWESAYAIPALFEASSTPLTRILALLMSRFTAPYENDLPINICRKMKVSIEDV